MLLAIKPITVVGPIKLSDNCRSVAIDKHTAGLRWRPKLAQWHVHVKERRPRLVLGWVTIIED